MKESVLGKASFDEIEQASLILEPYERAMGPGHTAEALDAAIDSEVKLLVETIKRRDRRRGEKAR